VSQETLVSLLVGSVIGIVATWAFAHVYYRRAGEDLRREAENLREETGRARQLINILAQCLETAGLIEPTWREGQLAGVKVPVSKIESTSKVFTPTLTVGPPPPHTESKS
jgi:hypothetical protein